MMTEIIEVKMCVRPYPNEIRTMCREVNFLVQAGAEVAGVPPSFGINLKNFLTGLAFSRVKSKRNFRKKFGQIWTNFQKVGKFGQVGCPADKIFVIEMGIFKSFMKFEICVLTSYQISFLVLR